MKILRLILIVFLGGMLWLALNYLDNHKRHFAGENPYSIIDTLWHAPDSTTIPTGVDGDIIRYGRELIRNTSRFLGPKGSVNAISNGMNCQNCHIEAGTRPFGNNYSAVYSTYPKFRARSGKMEDIFKRVNDCFERSLNGHALDTNSSEMKAIVSYITWLGTDVEKGEKPAGSGLTELDYLDRAASPMSGKRVYEEKCQTCHQSNGQGVANADNTGFFYPPLWGDFSYNTGAGLFRLSRLAGYVKSNMPLGATHDAAQLTTEQAWDVAAFVNSQPRPVKDLSADWPDIAAKPLDHPFGPFADGFSEQQHKYGPFSPIKSWKKNHAKKK